MTCPRGVSFDGTNDWMLRGSNLSAIADGRQGSFCVWYKSKADASTRYLITNDTGDTRRIEINKTGANLIRVFVADSTGSSTFTIVSTATVLVADGWVNILGSWDTNFSAGNKLGQIYINDAAGASLTDANAAFDIAYATGITDFSVGALVSGSGKTNADLARFWFSTEVIDFSITANRRKFISAALAAVDLGADGSTPTGNQPPLYLEGPASAFATNLGFGGDFTVNGTLTDAADDPPCFVPPSPAVLLPGRVM